MASDMLDVSVVIPTHDRADLLFETVASVLRQTLPPREIIVVDNGVNGRASAALEPFGDKVRLVHSTPHAKQIARNVGIGIARSTWVATLDDDDLLAPDYLAEMAKPLRDGRADILSSDHRKFRDDQHEAETNFEKAPPGYWDGISRPLAGESWTYVGKFPLDRLLKRIPVYPSTMIIRRDFAMRIGGYDPQMLGIKAEDIEFLIRALAAGHLALVWKPLVHYRLHAGNETVSVDGQAIGRWKIFEFSRRAHSNLPPYFREALERDLPGRRRRIYAVAHRSGDDDALRTLRDMLGVQDYLEIYKQAYRDGDGALMQSLAALIPAGFWTADMKARRWIGSIPQPMARPVQKMIGRFTPRRTGDA